MLGFRLGRFRRSDGGAMLSGSRQDFLDDWFDGSFDGSDRRLRRRLNGERSSRSHDWRRFGMRRLSRNDGFGLRRGVDRLRLDFNLLDLTALGRQETWENSPTGWPQTEPYSWWRLHDQYTG